MLAATRQAAVLLDAYASPLGRELVHHHPDVLMRIGLAGGLNADLPRPQVEEREGGSPAGRRPSVRVRGDHEQEPSRVGRLRESAVEICRLRERHDLGQRRTRLAQNLLGRRDSRRARCRSARRWRRHPGLQVRGGRPEPFEATGSPQTTQALTDDQDTGRQQACMGPGRPHPAATRNKKRRRPGGAWGDGVTHAQAARALRRCLSCSDSNAFIELVNRAVGTASGVPPVSNP